MAERTEIKRVAQAAAAEAAAEVAKETAKETTPASDVTKRQKWMWTLGIVAALGGTITAITTLTGVNLRPAWGYEIAQLTKTDTGHAEKLQRLERVQGTTTRVLETLQRGQYDIRLDQIDRSRRETRRELAEHQTRAEGFRRESQPVPGWLRNAISDAEGELERLADERRGLEAKLLKLEKR